MVLTSLVLRINLFFKCVRMVRDWVSLCVSRGWWWAANVMRTGHSGAVLDMKLQPDETSLLSASADQTLMVCNALFLITLYFVFVLIALWRLTSLYTALGFEPGCAYASSVCTLRASSVVSHSPVQAATGS